MLFQNIRSYVHYDTKMRFDKILKIYLESLWLILVIPKHV